MPDPITPRHAAQVLARAAAIDNRDPSAAADEVWADALTRANVDFRDCLAAVGEHYASSTDRLMPFHVIAIARRLAADRAEAEANRLALAPPPDDVIPAEEGTRRVWAMLAAHRAAKRSAGSGGYTGTDGPVSAVSGPHSGLDGDARDIADPSHPWFQEPADDVLTETYPGSGIYE